jgi:hypothetical protein
MRATAGIALMLGLSACAPHYPTTVPSSPGAAPTPSVAPAPAPAPSPVPVPQQSPVPKPQAAARDACGAADLQRLVGRPRTEIPVPIDPNRQRVACTTCPVTEEFVPDRLNFFFDALTGRIKQIRCG